MCSASACSDFPLYFLDLVECERARRWICEYRMPGAIIIW